MINDESISGQQGLLAQPLSHLLQTFYSDKSPDLSFGDIADRVARRSLGSMLGLFSALNLLPLPPGTSMVTGLPIVLIAVQLIFMGKNIWLPKIVREKRLSPVKMDAVLDRLLKWSRWLETYLKPRHWPFSIGVGDRFVGIICLILGIFVVFPIPFANFAPAFAAAILGMSLAERDGLWLLAGLISAVCSIIWVISILAGAFYSISLIS